MAARPIFDASQIRLGYDAINGMMNAGVWPVPPLPPPSIDNFTPLALSLAEIARSSAVAPAPASATAGFAATVGYLINETTGAKHAGEMGAFVGKRVVLAFTAYVDSRKGSVEEVTLAELLGGAVAWLEADINHQDQTWYGGLGEEDLKRIVLAREQSLDLEGMFVGGEEGGEESRVRSWAFKIRFVEIFGKWKNLVARYNFE